MGRRPGRRIPLCGNACVNMSLCNLNDGLFKDSFLDSRISVIIGLGGVFLPATRVNFDAASS